MTLIIIFLIIGIVVVLILFEKDSHPANWILKRRKSDAWQELADKFDLTYLPGQDLTEAHLFGNYRDYQLDLKVIEESNAGITRKFTILTLAHQEEMDNPKKKSPISSSKDVKSLLTLSDLPITIKGQIDIQANGQVLTYTQPGVEYDRIYLSTLFDFIHKLLSAYSTLINSRSEFVAELKAIANYRGLSLQPFAEHTLQNINEPIESPAETLYLICPRCIAYYQKEATLFFNLNSNPNDGCHICHQRQGYLIGKIIAVLDSQMPQKVSQIDHTLRVNWLADRTIFDFDRVEINQATDEEVERFVVQVGNDTDPAQKSKYKKIQCIISADCELSENTIRILQRTFGELVTKKSGLQDNRLDSMSAGDNHIG